MAGAFFAFFYFVSRILRMERRSLIYLLALYFHTKFRAVIFRQDAEGRGSFLMAISIAPLRIWLCHCSLEAGEYMQGY
jgi:hypothetical protein